MKKILIILILISNLALAQDVDFFKENILPYLRVNADSTISFIDQVNEPTFGDVKLVQYGDGYTNYYAIYEQDCDVAYVTCPSHSFRVTAPNTNGYKSEGPIQVILNGGIRPEMGGVTFVVMEYHTADVYKEMHRSA